ncbi:MAG: pyridoxamine 5'-phosphate oxidase family protein [Acidobacteria bacterium]|nr:pyridoxamine 5'-phosphate oxidase family protein [Acidobacteriota bacterium]
MSQELGARLPGDVLAEVSKEVPRFNAVPLVTLDREGFSHVALLSYFELFLHGDSLHFFLNCFSRSTKFLKERPRCTLMFVHSDFVYYIKGHVRWVGDFESQSVFQFAVESVWEDFPSREEGEVFLKTGIRIGGGEEETLRRRHFREKIASQVEVRAREGRVKI